MTQRRFLSRMTTGAFLISMCAVVASAAYEPKLILKFPFRCEHHDSLGNPVEDSLVTNRSFKATLYRMGMTDSLTVERETNDSGFSVLQFDQWTLDYSDVDSASVGRLDVSLPNSYRAIPVGEGFAFEPLRIESVPCSGRTGETVVVLLPLSFVVTEFTIGSGQYGFDFGVLSDIHIGHGKKLQAGKEDFGSPGYDDADNDPSEKPPELQTVEAGVAYLGGLATAGLRFVALTGDITQSSERSEYQRARKILARLDSRVFFVPLIGNHDGWPYVGRQNNYSEQPVDDVAIGEYYYNAFSGVYDTLWHILPIPNWQEGSWLRTSTTTTGQAFPSYYNDFAFNYQGCRFIATDFCSRARPPKVWPFDYPGLKGPPETGEAEDWDWTWDWLHDQIPAGSGVPAERTICLGHYAYCPTAWGNNFTMAQLAEIKDAGLRNNRPIATSIGGHIDELVTGWVNPNNGPDTICYAYALNNASYYGHVYVFHVRDSVQAGILTPPGIPPYASRVSFQRAFDWQGDNAPVSQVWDFGDGSSPAYDVNPSHLFHLNSHDSLFKVTLMVSTASGKHVWAGDTVRVVASPYDLHTSEVREQEVRLEWSFDCPDLIDHYEVTRNDVRLPNINPNQRWFVDQDGLQPGHTYQYEIAAAHTNGIVSPPDRASVYTPFVSAPTNLAARMVARGRIQLGWTDNSGLEVGFRISRRLNQNSWIDNYGSVAANVTEFGDAVVPGNRYAYRVCALDGLGHQSGWSNEVLVSTLYEPEYAEIDCNPGHPGPVAITSLPLGLLYSCVRSSVTGGYADSMQVSLSYCQQVKDTATFLDTTGWLGYRQHDTIDLDRGQGKYLLEAIFLIKTDSQDVFVVLSDSCFVVSCIAPTLSSPPNEARNQPLNTEFVWQSLVWSPSYDLYLGTDSSLTRVDSNSTDTSYTCSDLTSYQKYYWRVVARYLGREDSSEIRSFRTRIVAERPLVSSSGRAARRLVRNPDDGSIAAVSEIVQGSDTLIGLRVDCSQPDSSWFQVAEGSDPELAFASDGSPWLAYLADHDSDLVIAYMRQDSSWKALAVLNGSPALKLGSPSLALFQGASGRVAQVALSAYDSAGSSMILFIQADTSTFVLDTADYAAGSFADSACHIEAGITDTARLLFSRADTLFYRELSYQPTAVTRPDTWSKLSRISDTLALASQPFCEQVGNRLYVTFRQIDNPGAGQLYSIQRTSCDLSSAARTWEGLGPVSKVDTIPKGNPVLSGSEAVAWTEAGEHSVIKAKIADSLLVLSCSDTNSAGCAILCDTAVQISPSTVMRRLRYLWSSQLCSDTWALCAANLPVHTSDAGANATQFNTGRKVLLDEGDLHAVYRSKQGSLYYSKMEDAEGNWSSSILRNTGLWPAISADYLHRLWVGDKDQATGMLGVYDIIRCQNRASGGPTWTDFVVYPVGTAVPPTTKLGPVSIAACPSDTGGQNRSCSYLVWPLYEAYAQGTKSRILMAKVSATGRMYIDTLHTASDASDSFPSICAHEVGAASGYALSVTWQNGSEVYYKKTTNQDQPQFTTKRTWSDNYNLSNTQGLSKHPMMAASNDTVLVAWIEQGNDSGRVLVRGQNEDASYNTWADTVNVSQCPDTCTDYPTITIGDSIIVEYQKRLSPGNLDVIACVNFHDNLNISGSSVDSRYPHCAFELRQDSLPILHSVWTEDLSPNQAEVGYSRWQIGEEGGGGAMSRDIFDPSITPMLFLPWPNPSHTEIHVRYQINRQGPVQLDIYDLTGRRLRSLVTGTQKPGIYDLLWNRTDNRDRRLGNGIYFLRISAPALTSTRKLVIE